MGRFLPRLTVKRKTSSNRHSGTRWMRHHDICLQMWKLQVVSRQWLHDSTPCDRTTHTTDCRVVLCCVCEFRALLRFLCDGKKYEALLHSQQPVGYKWMNQPPFFFWERRLVIGGRSRYTCTDLSHAQMTVIWSRRNAAEVWHISPEGMDALSCYWPFTSTHSL